MGKIKRYKRRNQKN